MIDDKAKTATISLEYRILYNLLGPEQCASCLNHPAKSFVESLSEIVNGTATVVRAKTVLDART